MKLPARTRSPPINIGKAILAWLFAGLASVETELGLPVVENPPEG
jgi:hypothetical protein